jgi:calmodulin-regulated spectrin-associated protein
VCEYHGEFIWMTSCYLLRQFLRHFSHKTNAFAFQAKQRASIRWLLSKAYNNRVPDQLREPFYSDHDGNLHLKPQIVVGLGNASIYCQVLANVYSDPNYQSLNHWSILQTLSRKGVPILEERAGEPPLTETVLIQTNPIRIVSRRSR